MEIDFQAGDLVKHFGAVAVIAYAHPCDPMTQILCKGQLMWAHRDNLWLVGCLNESR